MRLICCVVVTVRVFFSSTIKFLTELATSSAEANHSSVPLPVSPPQVVMETHTCPQTIKTWHSISSCAEQHSYIMYRYSGGKKNKNKNLNSCSLRQLSEICWSFSACHHTQRPHPCVSRNDERHNDDTMTHSYNTERGRGGHETDSWDSLLLCFSLSSCASDDKK